MKNIKVDTTATTPKKSIKRVKGMTLIECIIALAIFGIMAAVMIAGCLHVYNSKKNTDKITKRTSYETPAVANKSTFTGQEATDATPAVPGDVVQGTGSMTIGGATVNYVTYDAVDNNGVPGLGYFVAPGRNSTPTTTTPADDTDDTDDTEEPPVTTATP
jgi:prepilin-type N-terminal cleavage/methylation domain-containing protein